MSRINSLTAVSGSGAGGVGVPDGTIEAPSPFDSGQAVAKGIASLADPLEEMQKQRNVQELADLDTTASQRIRQLQADSIKNNDPTMARDQFDASIAALREELTGKASNKAVKADFLSRFDRRADAASSGVMSRTVHQELANGAAKVEANINEGAEAMAAAGNDAEYETARQIVDQAIENSPYHSEAQKIKMREGLHRMVRKRQAEIVAPILADALNQMEKAVGSVESDEVFDKSIADAHDLIDMHIGHEGMDEKWANAQKRIEDKQFTGARFAHLMEKDPAAAAQFIDKYGVRMGIDPSQVRTMHDQAKRAQISVDQQTAAGRMVQIGGRIDDELNKPDFAFSPGALKEIVASGLTEYMALPGAVQQGSAVSRADQAEKTMAFWLESNLKAYALKGDDRRYNAIRDSIPLTGKFKELIAQQDKVFNESSSFRKSTAAAAEVLAGERATLTAGPASPNDPAAVNLDYNNHLRGGGTFEGYTAYAAVRAKNGLNLPDDYYRDLSNAMNPERTEFDPDSALRAFRKIQGVNKPLADRLPAMMKDTAFASAAYEATRHVDPNADPKGWAEVVSILKNPRAKFLADRAQYYISHVDPETKQAVPMQVSDVLSGFIGGGAPTYQMADEFKGQFRYQFMRRIITNQTPNDKIDDVADVAAAQKAAAGVISDNYQKVVVPGVHGWLYNDSDIQYVPKSWGLGNVAAHDTDKPNIVNGGLDRIMTDHFSAAGAKFRIDRSLNYENSLYIPLVSDDTGQTLHFIDYNKKLGTMRIISPEQTAKNHKLYSIGLQSRVYSYGMGAPGVIGKEPSITQSDLDRSQAASPVEFAHIKNLSDFAHDPKEAMPYSPLMWRMEYGNLSPVEVDSRMPEYIMDAVRERFKQANGHLPSTPEERKSMIDGYNLFVKNVLGWRNTQPLPDPKARKQ